MLIRKFVGPLARRIMVLFFYIPVLPVLWILEPFLGIRIGLVYTQRIGHLAANTDVFFRSRPEKDKGKRRTYILTGWDPANRQLFKMFERSCGIIESRWLTRIVFAWRRSLIRTRFWQPMFFNGREYKLYNSTDPVIAFTPDEELLGCRELEKMGVGKDNWFIGFHARDSAYLDKWRPEEADFWRKVDFKNTDIRTYMEAVTHISDLGGYALRMGAVVERPLESPLPSRVIEYAAKYRSDFMDIYLVAKCRFFLGSSTGLGSVPTVFNRPVIIANHFPYNHTHYRSNDLIIPRPILDKETHAHVPFHQAQADGFFAWQEGVSSNGTNNELYDWGYNDPIDILNGVLDMLDILEGREPPKGADIIQQRYGERYLAHLPDYQLGAKLSPRYALRHAALI